MSPRENPVSSSKDIVSIDPTDPAQWGPAVERMAQKMADRMWGAPHWYRGAANDALTTVFDLDPKDTSRMLRVWLEMEREYDGEGSGPAGF